MRTGRGRPCKAHATRDLKRDVYVGSRFQIISGRKMERQRETELDEDK